MTVSTTTNQVIYDTNGSTTVFPFSFKVLDEDHISVERRDTTTGLIDKVYVASEYTLAGVDEDAGSVTISPALAAGYEIIITRTVPYTQLVDIVNQGGFYPDVIEEQLDVTAMGLQQISERVDRTIRVAPGDELEELPSAATRAGNYLAFDASGDPVVSEGTGADSGLRADLAATTGSALIGSAGGALDDVLEDTSADFVGATAGADPAGREIFAPALVTSLQARRLYGTTLRGLLNREYNPTNDATDTLNGFFEELAPDGIKIADPHGTRVTLEGTLVLQPDLILDLSPTTWMQKVGTGQMVQNPTAGDVRTYAEATFSAGSGTSLTAVSTIAASVGEELLIVNLDANFYLQGKWVTVTGIVGTTLTFDHTTTEAVSANGRLIKVLRLDNLRVKGGVWGTFGDATKTGGIFDIFGHNMRIESVECYGFLSGGSGGLAIFIGGNGNLVDKCLLRTIHGGVGAGGIRFFGGNGFLASNNTVYAGDAGVQLVPVTSTTNWAYDMPIEDSFYNGAYVESTDARIIDCALSGPQTDYLMRGHIRNSGFKSIRGKGGSQRSIVISNEDGDFTGDTISITDITQANPAVVTSVGHGLATGDDIAFRSVGGMTEVHHSVYTVTVLTADTFSLDGEDSTAYTAYTSGGTGYKNPTSLVPKQIDNITLDEVYVNGELQTSATPTQSVVLYSRIPQGIGRLILQNGEAFGAARSFGITAENVDDLELIRYKTEGEVNALRLAGRDMNIKINSGRYRIKDNGGGNDPSHVINIQSTVKNSTLKIDGNPLVENIARGMAGVRMASTDCDVEIVTMTANKDTSIPDPATITGITQANPAVVTATAHGFATGEVVEITSVSGMTEVNNQEFTITVIDANSFSLDGTDSTGYTAYTSGGMATPDPTAGVSTVAESTLTLQKISGTVDEEVIGGGEINYIGNVSRLVSRHTDGVTVDRTWLYASNRGTGNANLTYTLPADADLDVSPGEYFHYLNETTGAAVVTFAAGAGATVTGDATPTQGALVRVTKTPEDKWHVSQS